MKQGRLCLLLTAMLLLALITGCGADGQVREAEPGELAGSGALEETPSELEDETPDSAPPVAASEDDPAAVPTVFMTTDISSEGLMAVYEALEASPTGSIAVKLSTGEQLPAH